MENNRNPLEGAETRARMFNITALASEYCSMLENARELDRDQFVKGMCLLLPRIYHSFLDLEADEADSGLDLSYYPDYVDEYFYDSVRRNAETLLGPDDTFLETFEEDMKYSDTPIASSISECLADIFQPLYNFLSVSRESEGEQSGGAYRECRENFDSYWGQTLCNVLRALNTVRVQSISQL